MKEINFKEQLEKRSSGYCQFNSSILVITSSIEEYESLYQKIDNLIPPKKNERSGLYQL